jgi:hypothetical protein
VDARFGLFVYTTNLHERFMDGMRRMYHRLGNRFRHSEEAQVDARFRLFRHSANLDAR